jgi:formylmethanofuran dehydrogenase subunit E
MKTLADYLREADKEGRPRSGIILGIRLVVRAMKELGIDDPAEVHRQLIAFVETDRCLPDAVELVTGCRLGNRTLKPRDLGKMAATFLDLRTNRAVRLAARETANQRALEAFKGLEKEEALARAYREWPDEELFSWQPVRVELPAEDRPGHRAPRVICADCGEGISFHREVARGGRTLCRSCAGDRYYIPG